MPSTYAHDRFGARVLEKLSPDVRAVIQPHRALYDIGLQGPDVLFHYKALSKNAVNALGHAMHRQSGKDFFGALLGKAQDDAARAYLCGLLCHFALDSACHSSVNAIAAKAGVHHFDVETELERALMLLDGKDPVRFRPTAHFDPSADLGRVMADLFGIAEGEAVISAKGMKRNIDLLVPRNAVWRGLVSTILRAAHADTFHRLMIPKERKLEKEIAELIERCVQTEAIALRLIAGFFDGTLLADEQLLRDFATGSIVEENT